MLDVGSFSPRSSVHFPGKVAAVVSLHGCPWDCLSCDRPGLQAWPATGQVCWTTVLGELERLRGDVEAVTFTGGEPTLQAALGRGIAQVRRMGLAVGLHTAGIYPRRLAGVLPDLDWVALDVKAPLEDYPRITRRLTGAEAVLRSLDHLLARRTPHEVRTTWHPSLYPAERLLVLARSLAGRGVRDYALQLHAPGGGEDLAAPPGAVLAELGALFERFRCLEPAGGPWP